MLIQMEADTNASNADNVEATPAETVEPEGNNDEQAVTMLVGAMNKIKEVK